MWRLAGGLLISLALVGCASNAPFHQYGATISNPVAEPQVATAPAPTIAPTPQVTSTAAPTVAASPTPTSVGGPYVAASPARAETSERPKPTTYNHDYVANLSKCLSSYSYGCRQSELSADDLAKVRTAEYQRNLSSCLSSFSYNCKTDLLHVDDAERVRLARYQTALNSCLSEYSLSCRSSDLTPQDQERVRQAQYQFNLARCLKQPLYRCNKDTLNDEDKKRVAALEVSAPQPSPSSIPTTTPRGGCAENGSCFGDVSSLTGRPKTTYVRGYYRKNGVYVRSHYRSRR